MLHYVQSAINTLFRASYVFLSFLSSSLITKCLEYSNSTSVASRQKQGKYHHGKGSKVKFPALTSWVHHLTCV